MKKIALLFFLLVLSCSTTSQNEEKVISEIKEIMKKQVDSWNAASIEGFMEYYWKSEEFTFQSGNIRLKGWQKLLDRYKKNYSGENQGKLDFTDIDVKLLTKSQALVLGRWRVILPDTTKEGLFTLIVKNLPEGWRIIHDHSS